MAQEPDHLGDFIRNKLNSSGPNEGGWDAPDPGVRAELLSQLTSGAVFTSAAVSLKLVAWAASVLIGVVAVAGYLASDHIDSLNQQTQAQHEQIQDMQLEIDSLIDRYEGDVADMQNGLRLVEQQRDSVRQAARTWQYIAEDQQQTLGYFQQMVQKQAVSIQKAENKFGDSVSQQVLAGEEVEVSLPNDLIPLPWQNAPLPYSLGTASPNVQLGFDPFTIKPSRIEIGYQASWKSQNLAATWRFENLRHASGGEEDQQKWMQMHGLDVGIPLRRNLWIRTGLKVGRLNVDQSYNLTVAYDNQREFSLRDSLYANDLTLTKSTLYGESEEEIRILLARRGDLRDDELIEVSLQESYTRRLVQVPLGLSYFHGENRLQWWIQAGVQWNHLRGYNYELTANVETEGRFIKLEHRHSRQRPSYHKQYLSTYGGVGLNYQLTRHVHVRGGLSYQFELLGPISNTLSNSNRIGTAIELGVYRRF